MAFLASGGVWKDGVVCLLGPVAIRGTRLSAALRPHACLLVEFRK